jgi:hypothetical protein
MRNKIIKMSNHNLPNIGTRQYSSSNRPPGMSGDRIDKLSSFSLNFSDHQKFLASFHKDEKFFKYK